MKPEPLINYKDYIKSDYWEERKRKYFETHDRTCAVCGHPDVDLHHIKYGNYGSERDSDLAPLCRFHHQELHFTIGVRRDTKYQSAHVIEELREKWSGQFRTLPVESMPVSTPQLSLSEESNFELLVEKLAAPAWKLLAFFGFGNKQ
jgi:hypothetical protein